MWADLVDRGEAMKGRLRNAVARCSGECNFESVTPTYTTQPMLAIVLIRPTEHTQSVTPGVPVLPSLILHVTLLACNI